MVVIAQAVAAALGCDEVNVDHFGGGRYTVSIPGRPQPVRQVPQPVDPETDLHALLDNVIREVMLAKAAIADEREGDLNNSVHLMLNRVTQLHAIVGAW